MNIGEVESLLQIDYKDKKNFTIIGSVYNFFVNKLIGDIERRKSKNGSYLKSIDEFLSERGVEIQGNIDCDFKELFMEGESSFIFYGDHRFYAEPILTISGLDSDIKSVLYDSDTLGESRFKMFATDVFLIYAPWFINYIFPVILRDSSSQVSQFKKRFIKIRDRNHGLLSSYSIKKSSEYISNSGNTLLIFPQGTQTNRIWRTGLIRILDNFVRKYPERLSKTYLVPVACSKVKQSLTVLLIRAIIKRLAGISFTVEYGKPVALSEVMRDWNTNITEVKEIKPLMQKKILEIKKSYYKWTENVEGLGWK